MAIYSNIEIDQGTDFETSVTVTGTDGGPANLTGYAVAGQIRRTYKSQNAVTFTLDIPEPATAGIINVGLSAASSDTMKAGRYVYDIEVTSPQGKITRVIEGQVTIHPGVTR
jgi:hypothetical protein